MEKTVMERLNDARHNYETAYVSYLNNGRVVKDQMSSKNRIKSADDKDEFDKIVTVLCEATDYFCKRGHKFDTIKMELLLGLVNDAEDIKDKSNNEAEPINNVVRYYTDSINCYSNKEQTNAFDFREIGVGRQSFIKYDKLVKAVKQSGLEYDIPETFEEFKEKILADEKFDITLTANFKAKEDTDSKVKRI